LTSSDIRGESTVPTLLPAPDGSGLSATWERIETPAARSAFASFDAASFAGSDENLAGVGPAKPALKESAESGPM
jgi:hypothetical protein